jgi:hypothetical protein
MKFQKKERMDLCQPKSWPVDELMTTLDNQILNQFNTESCRFCVKSNFWKEN